MQNNDVRGKREGFQFAKYRWLAFLAVLVLAVVYVICKPPGSSPSTKDLFYEPLGGAWVDDSQGNGDREINPGEPVKVKPRLTNTGKQRLPAFDLVFSTSEPKVALQDNKCHYPASEPGQTVLPEDPFEFKLDSSFVSECVMFVGTTRNQQAIAGFVGDAFAQTNSDDQILITLGVIANYRVCMVGCNLEQGATATAKDILKIDLMICNSSGGQLTDATVKIDSFRVKLCNSPNALDSTFKVMRPVHILTNQKIRLDQLSYTGLLAGTCKTPQDPTGASNPSTFQFFGWLQPISGSTACVYFRALVFQGNSTTPVARAYVGVEAKVTTRPAEGPPIAANVTGDYENHH